MTSNFRLKNHNKKIIINNNTTPIIENGSLRTIERTKLSYVEPHRIIIKGITFLAFNYETNIYIENLSNKILIKDLEEYIKSI